MVSVDPISAPRGLPNPYVGLDLAIQAEQNPINRVLMSFGDRVPLRTRLDLGKNVY